MDSQTSNQANNNATIDAENRNKRLRSILWAVIGLLLASNIVVLYLLFNKNEQINSQSTTIAAQSDSIRTTVAKLDSIDKELNIRIDEIKKLGGDVTTLEQVKTELEKDKANLIANNKASGFTIQKYKDKIVQYEAMLTKKDEEINKLKGVNTELLSENTGLKETQVKLSDSIGGITKEKQGLQEVVRVASALKAENIQVFAVSESGKERDDKDNEFRAKRVDKVKIVCQLAENKVAKIEGKTVYLRIIEPDNVTLSDAASGGGSLTIEGNEIPYTAKQEFIFNNERQKITFNYRKGTVYKSGRHRAEMYAEGFKIGEGTFTIK
ncbi:MAG: hypothetical protein H7Y04_09125 [Verrucomicrobia bacterium]|nr:hypothetical protein [Cytophagales bacterium]